MFNCFGVDYSWKHNFRLRLKRADSLGHLNKSIHSSQNKRSRPWFFLANQFWFSTVQMELFQNLQPPSPCFSCLSHLTIGDFPPIWTFRLLNAEEMGFRAPLYWTMWYTIPCEQCSKPSVIPYIIQVGQCGSPPRIVIIHDISRVVQLPVLTGWWYMPLYLH